MEILEYNSYSRRICLFVWVKTLWLKSGMIMLKSLKMLEGGPQHWGLGARSAIQRADIG